MTASKGAKAKGKTKPRAKAKPKPPTPPRARARKEWTADFLAALRVGHTKRSACSLAGIHYTTVYERLGKDADFAAATEAAEDAGVLNAEAALLLATPMDWRATAFYLERRRPQDWGRKQEVEHSGSVRVGVVEADPRVEAMKADPTQAELLRGFLDALASRK